MLKERISQCDQRIANKIELESIDAAIRRLLNHGRKKSQRAQEKGCRAQEKSFCAGPS